MGNYDNFTIEVFDRFAREFNILFPGILSCEEIKKIITSNIHSSIVLDDLSSEKVKGEQLLGYYNDTRHIIVIEKSLKNKDLYSTLFHELIHVLTIHTPKNENNFIDGEFVTETITTVMQEEYEKKFYGVDKTKINVYISNYAKELEIIFGNELFSQYVKNGRNIESLFRYYPKYKDVSNYEIFKEISDLCDEVFLLLDSNDVEKVTYLNSIIELNMTILLANYLKYKTDLSEDEKLDKINRLLSIMKSPNIDLIKVITIYNITDRKSLDKYEDLKYILNPDLDRYSIQREKYINFYSSKKFDMINYRIDNLLYYDDNYINFIGKEVYYSSLGYLLYTKKISMEEIYNSKYYVVYNNEIPSVAEEFTSGADHDETMLLDLKSYYTGEVLFKVENDNDEYYVSKDFNVYICSKHNIVDMLDCINDKNTVKELKKLHSRGINEVFCNNCGKLIIEEDNKVTVLDKNFKTGIYNTKTYNTEELNLFNNSSKRLINSRM